MRSATYYLAMAFLLTHELDAVQHAEWHLLFVLRTLDPPWAYSAFVLLHIPIVFVLLWLANHANALIRLRFRLVTAGFTLIHAAIHFRLVGSPEYTFEGWLSNGLIFGSAVLGSVYLLLEWMANRWSLSIEEGKCKQ
ncbi:MAG: DUF6713 family protein [Pseudomonadota bacterium]